MASRPLASEHDGIRYKEVAMFKLLSRLSRLPWRKAPCVARRRPCGPPPQPLEAERTLGCGWFDSSHDLSHGLQVGDADAGAYASLSITEWLRLDPCAVQLRSTLA